MRFGKNSQNVSLNNDFDMQSEADSALQRDVKCRRDSNSLTFAPGQFDFEMLYKKISKHNQ